MTNPPYPLPYHRPASSRHQRFLTAHHDLHPRTFRPQPPAPERHHADDPNHTADAVTGMTANAIRIFQKQDDVHIRKASLPCRRLRSGNDKSHPASHLPDCDIPNAFAINRVSGELWDMVPHHQAPAIPAAIQCVAF